MPKVSIIVPIHDMTNGDKFLWRLVNSLTEQTFTDWELNITKEGKMAENTNAGIRRARGEYIKILYLDDFFSKEDSLFAQYAALTYYDKPEWMIVGTNNNQEPTWTNDLENGNNKLGSPSALIFKNHFEDNLFFDETMDWLLDCDYYKRMNEKYKFPIIFVGDWISLGQGDHQMTHILTNEQKLSEHEYMKHKYE